ncbi:DUF411 domain-containing protein [Piscinibacter sakaiensis]|uniref:DUF411 domain-containing protein n=1 Tax=Piscinibacter sakaiensis TaxID=1547922 RepID=UPI003AAB473D
MNHTNRLPTRRKALLLGAAAFAAPLAVWAAAPTRAPLVEVWKSPSCGCCKDWVAHLEGNGFRVNVHDTGNTAMREQLGMPERFGGCHTARVGGYVIEGHVPAADIHRLLKQKPAALGLAVPGMPIGSPGMDGPAYGGQKEAYDVLLVARNGGATVFQSHR